MQLDQLQWTDPTFAYDFRVDDPPIAIVRPELDFGHSKLGAVLDWGRKNEIISMTWPSELSRRQRCDMTTLYCTKSV